MNMLSLFAAAGLCVGLASPAAGAPAVLTLRCTITRTVTGADGGVRRTELVRTLRLGDNLYQDWSPTSGWSANRCVQAPCKFNGSVFRYRSDTPQNQGGIPTRRVVQVIYDNGSHVMDNKEVVARVQDPAALKADSTTYEHGRCEPSADPARPTQ
jgi:hypothetical protein